MYARQGEKSLRDQLLEKWQERSELEDASESEERRRQELLLSGGGMYTVPDLRARGALLELLAASIDLMHHDLELLIRELLARVIVADTD